MVTIGSRVALVLLGLLAFASHAFAQQRIAPGEVTIANQGDYELGQDIAYNSVHDEFLVVWSDYNYPTSRIMGRRLRYDGRPVGNAFQVAPSTGNGRFGPRVAYDKVHDYYLVVYTYDYGGGDRDLHGIFLSWDGAALTAEQVLANTNAPEFASSVAFSWVSSKFLVVWQQNAFDAIPAEFKGMLVGNPSSAAFTVTPGPEGADAVAAWDPWSNNFLVVYERGGDVFGKLIHASGTVGSEIAIAGWPASEGFAWVASCENYQFLVVWNSPSVFAEGFDSEVYGRFLLGNGALWGDPIHFNGSSAKEWRPRAACLYGGTDYLVAYTQSTETGTPWWWESQIYAQRLRSTGALEPLGFVPISPPAGKQDDVAIVTGSRVGWLVSVMRGDDLAPAPSDWDLYGRVAWQLFSESFEWGSTSAWDSHVP